METNEVVVPQIQNIKHFLFLRKDLIGYNIGGFLAQACHASVAAINKTKDHPETIEYLKNVSHLTTVIYGINENDIKPVTQSLTDLDIEYFLWIEDGVMETCIGTRPIDTSNRPDFLKFRKNFKLFKL